MKICILTSATCILLSAVPGAFSLDVCWCGTICLSLLLLGFSAHLCCFAPYQENHLRGSLSAIAINVGKEFAGVTNDEVQNKCKKGGICGTTDQSSRCVEDDPWCTCMNQRCCSSLNKCNNNRSTCTSCGFNCVSLDEDMPWNKGLKESSNCESKWCNSGDSICNYACNRDLAFIQQE